MSANKSITILGTRGIPAEHGGFETFAENLSRYFVKLNWDVTVYCQEEGSGAIYNSHWKGIRRIHIPVNSNNVFSTIIFDLKSILHARKDSSIHFVLGYNTFIFNLIDILYGNYLVVNMDGLEWKRSKWGFVARSWLYMNERCACYFANKLVADNPHIKEHLGRGIVSSKTVMIPYGASQIEKSDVKLIEEFGLVPHNYFLVIARPEPENSILEIIRAFSAKKRNAKLVILGDYNRKLNGYKKDVLEAASSEVFFLGAIYNPEIVSALREHCRYYIHGHTVGGTNPSLVEALGSGSAVIAQDNRFNRWVTDNGCLYFKSAIDLEKILDEVCLSDSNIKENKVNSMNQYNKLFKWDTVLEQYEDLFTLIHDKYL